MSDIVIIEEPVTSVIIEEQAPDEVDISDVGVQGPEGPQGLDPWIGPEAPTDGRKWWYDTDEESSTVRAVFIGSTPPVAPGGPYAWFQTGLGGGSDLTLWIEDGS